MLFPFVMTAVSVPLVTLALAGYGGYIAGVTWWENRRERWSDEVVVYGQVLLSAFVPIMIIAFPNTPIFGGTKHWMPAMPFFAILGGIGGARLLTQLPNPMNGAPIRVVCGAILVSAPLWATVEYGSQGPLITMESSVVRQARQNLVCRETFGGIAPSGFWI